MEKEKGAGIDYGMGINNIDKKTGIHYGVISIHEVLQAWSDDSEAQYNLYCPHCGAFLKKGFDAKRCPSCYKRFDDYSFEDVEPDHFTYDGEGYQAQQNADDSDIFITKSPYYTLCAFCSPCAPGAGYLMDSREDGIKAYCFNRDWFETGKAPYPVYEVKTGKLVEAPTKETKEAAQNV